MLRNRIYYRLKPFIPRSVRLGIRSWMARRMRPRVEDQWPIMQGSERPPAGWPGWPEGKQFAFVLTHDVEGQRGVDNCRPLALLEQELGFRSSFNFIPEGEYTVSPDLRSWLANRGHEVGVHDLKHDGMLYQSRAKFKQQAAKINDYVRDWGASGFRSGFMLNELDWLHDLNVQYDSSTFDTDPFEPQPEGCGTIFPYWVSASESEAYVELPYTLAQDSTLFLILREKTIEIWKRKLDWIAQHGGMALLNVHPDYLQFGDVPGTADTYPVALYSELLRYVRDTYGDRVWQALPQEVAQFARTLKRPVARRAKRICMVAYSHYETDGRVTRYAQSLAERGDHVDVVALKTSAKDPSEAKVGRVHVHNLQSRLGKNENSPAAYLFPVLRFLWRATRWIAARHARRPYDVLHIHNMPDFLVFAAALPKLKGAKVILDIHDIVPEFYGNKFGKGNQSLVVWILRLFERICACMADRVIISNDLWLDKYASRTGANGKCSVFINNVDSEVFKPHPRTRQDEKLIVLFPGGLQWHQGLDIALRAFKTVHEAIPNAEFHIYGEGSRKGELIRLAETLGCSGSVRFFAPVRLSEIAVIMANADLGVVPKRADSFGNEAYSTKIMEFMSVGVPVVISETKIDRYYFDDSVARFFPSGDADALAAEMIKMLGDATLRREMAGRALDYAAKHCWHSREGDYRQLVDSVADHTSP